MTQDVDALKSSLIVIVDDEPSNIVLLEKILEKEGFTDVVSTTDGRKALELVGSLDPDLLLLDLQMPRMDGFEVLSTLRGMSQTQYLPVLVLTADMTHQAKTRSLELGAKDFLTKPFDRTEVVLRIGNLLETRSLQKRLLDQNVMLETRVHERTRALRESVHRLEIAEQEIRESQAETVQKLSIAAEFRDDETARHIVRMSHYCGFLARHAGCDGVVLENIVVASQMHDVGKIGTPDRILLKPGPLTPEERRIMERHAQDGWSILSGSKSELLQLAAQIALTHHERFDGSGYPNGVQAEDIPVVGRIAAIADVFDALSTDRVYRSAFPLDKVWQMLAEGKGAHFDPGLVDVFLEHKDEVIAIKTANDESGAKAPSGLSDVSAT